MEQPPRDQGSHLPRILVIDDEAGVAESLKLLLEQEGAEAHYVTHPGEAKAAIEAFHPDLILCDLRLPGISGRLLAEELLRHHPRILCAFMSAYGTLDTAQDLLKSGAIEYLEKPVRREQIRKLLERLHPPQVREILAQPAPPEARCGALIGEHPLMRNLFEMIRKVAPFPAIVLIRGESGAGKELVARVLHELSPRAQAPFVPVNCGAIPATLLESELFGYKRGAFTGADRDRPGLIQEAQGGTLFLDEIGELPLDLQVKLLRVLEEGRVLPLGGNKPLPVDVRWITATHQDLPQLVVQGKFRHDLYYRLKVIQLEVPPLRERREDLPLLAGDWLYRLNEKYGKGIQGIEAQASAILFRYPWRGNVRELQNVLERAYILTNGSWITAESLEVLLSPPSSPEQEERAQPLDLDLPRALKELEIRYIREALLRTGGNRTQAARLLRISHRALLYKIKEYGIEIPPPASGGSQLRDSGTSASPQGAPRSAGESQD